MRILRILPLLLAACGGGGAADPGNPFLGDIVDNPQMYADPGTNIVDVYVTIWPADNPESEEDQDCDFINHADGIGTTLDHVDQDVDPFDSCKPELNVRMQIAGLVDGGDAPNAEMRLRGKSTRFAAQKSYRLKINRKDADGLWRGQRVLKLESDPTFDDDEFESILDIEEGDDHTVLLEMLDALNDPSSDFDEVFATYFNEQNYLIWLACNILFGNLDTNSQNFFLYRPSESRVFYFMPWDYDEQADRAYHGVKQLVVE